MKFVLRQTGAIFIDAFRELNSKRMFWIVLLLSGLVVAVFACLGINQQGLTILAWEIPFQINTNNTSPETFYKMLFTNFGIGIWLTWIATILALVSTASIFPDFLAGGSIELSLSRPIGRVRLFLTKYAAALLFVALQVAVFTAAAFLLIGVRGGAWEPGLFLAVPLVLIFFSYLYSICVLLGVLTRSAVPALLLTLLIWLGLFGIHAVESTLLSVREMSAARIENINNYIEYKQQREQAAADQPEEETRGYRERFRQAVAGRLRNPWGEVSVEQAQQRLEEEQQRHQRWKTWHRGFLIGKTVLPKTSETIDLLERTLVSTADLDKMMEDQDPEPVTFSQVDQFTPDNRQFTQRMEQQRRQRSAWWILGTSLAFEAFVLAIAAGIFARRDF